MSFDDELRRRMQQAADAAGEGADPAAIAAEVATRAAKGGVRPPLRLLGALGVTGLLAGGALGFTAMSPDDPAPGPAVAIGTQQYSLFDCPDGAAIGTAYPGDRVYVVGRDDTGGWLEVRDPRHQSTHLWVPADAVDPDAVADVPVVPCNDPVTMQAAEAETTTSSAAPVETTTPPTTSAPKPNQAPVIGAPQAVPGTIAGEVGCGPPGSNSTTITVTVTDDSGPPTVRVDWSLPKESGGTQTGSVMLTRTGTTYSGVITSQFNPPTSRYMTITITATDAKGLSSVKSANKLVYVDVCLI